MSTPVELQRAKEQQLAATREGLGKALHDTAPAAYPWRGTAYGREQYRKQADAILSSGEVQDADEIRRADFAAIEARYRVEREKGRAELQAVIEAAIGSRIPAGTTPETRAVAAVLTELRSALLAADARVLRYGYDGSSDD